MVGGAAGRARGGGAGLVEVVLGEGGTAAQQQLTAAAHNSAGSWFSEAALRASANSSCQALLAVAPGIFSGVHLMLVLMLAPHWLQPTG